MDFGWETGIERLRRHMRIPPKRKLELLYELNRFTNKYSVKNLPHSDDRTKKARSRYQKSKIPARNTTKHGA